MPRSIFKLQRLSSFQGSDTTLHPLTGIPNAAEDPSFEHVEGGQVYECPWADTFAQLFTKAHPHRPSTCLGVAEMAEV